MLHLHDLLNLQNGLPQLFTAAAWKRKSGSVAILRPPTHGVFSQPANWNVRFVEKRYAAIGQALGLKPTRSALERTCVSMRHLALLAPIIEIAAAATLQKVLSNARVTPHDIPPPSPCVDYDPDTKIFTFIAHRDYFGWAANTGWKIDADPDQYPITMDPYRVAALARQFTPTAHAAAIAAGVSQKLIDAFAEDPVGRPFLTVRPGRDGFRLYGPSSIAELALTSGFDEINLSCAWETDNITAAIRLIDLADPLLKSALSRVTSPDKLVAVDEIDLTDLFTLIDDDASETGGGPAKKQTVAAAPRMTYARAKGQWRTADGLKARAAGFIQSPSGYWTTSDVGCARVLRDIADLEAEIAIQNKLADEYAARIALIPDLPDPNPRDGEKYDKAQLEAVHFAIKRPKSLNADLMGFGKTIVGVGVIDVLRPRRTLITTLAGNVESFRRHLIQFLRDPPPIHIAKADAIPQDGVTIISHDSLANATALLAAHWDLVITDEAHRFKAEESNRSAALYDEIYGLKADRSLDMTGTPIPNKPQDLYNTLHNCLPEIFPSRELFFRLYGLERVQDDTPQKADLRRHLGRLMRRTIMIRREKVMSVVKTRSTHVIHIDDPEVKQRLALELETYQRFESSRNFTERSQLLAEMTRMRRETARLKIPEAAERISICRVFGDPFIAFGHHSEIIDKLAEELELRQVHTLVLHGKTIPAHKRQAAIDLFQSGQYDGVAGGIKSIGTALTITRARRVFVIELGWDPYDMIQAEDRAYRRGQIYDVYVEYIVVAGSLDAYLAYVNNEKIRIATEILDNPTYVATSGDDFLQQSLSSPAVPT